MTSSDAAPALLGGGKVQSGYGLSAKCIYIREAYRSFEGKEEHLLEKKLISILQLKNMSLLDLSYNIWVVRDVIFALQLWTEARPNSSSVAMLFNRNHFQRQGYISTEIQKTQIASQSWKWMFIEVVIQLSANKAKQCLLF